MKKSSFALRALALSSTALLAACASAPEPIAPTTTTQIQVVDVEEKVTLEADSLFKFGQGNIEGLTAKGFMSLGALASSLKNDFVTINAIELVGHTDRIGSDAYNLALSQQRADTIKTFLQNRGITAPIYAKGVGKADPVTTDCIGNTPTPELIACLQPDRRVDMQIQATRLIEQQVEVEVEVPSSN